jgi:hypothetical protein
LNGPYLVAKKKTRPRSDHDGNMLSHSWSADNLRCFYV